LPLTSGLLLNTFLSESLDKGRPPSCFSGAGLVSIHTGVTVQQNGNNRNILHQPQGNIIYFSGYTGMLLSGVPVRKD
jgi:hypothetical protein